MYWKLWKREHQRLRYTSWSREEIVIDFLVSPCSFSFSLFCLPLSLFLPFCHLCFYLYFVFCQLPCFTVYFYSLYFVCPPPAPTPIHLFSCHILPILLLSIHPFLPPKWTGRFDLYLSGMDESQVWFKCPNYSLELWCPALGYVAPSLWLSYESWHSTTEPFTEARLRARSHKRLFQCTRQWKADGWWGKQTTKKYSDLFWSCLLYPPAFCSTLLVFLDKKVNSNSSTLTQGWLQWTKVLWCIMEHINSVAILLGAPAQLLVDAII